MIHRTSPDFWDAYARLPLEGRNAADAAFALLRKDASHPSLHLKKIARFWSARVGLRIRVLAVESPEGLLWFWIGTHAEYDRLLR